MLLVGVALGRRARGGRGPVQHAPVSVVSLGVW